MVLGRSYFIFFVEVFTYVIIKSFGVFFNDVKNSFDESNSRTSWIISICVFVTAFTAPLSIVLSNCFGHRLVVMAGGLIISMGMVPASFSQRIYLMYIALGVIVGLEYCLSFSPLSPFCHNTLTKGVQLHLQESALLCLLFHQPYSSEGTFWLEIQPPLLGSAAADHHGLWCLLRPVIIKGPGSPKTITHEPWREVQYMLEIEKTKTSIDSINSGVELTTSPKNVPSQATTEKEARAEQQQTKVAAPKHSRKKPPLLDFSILKLKIFICYRLFGLFATLGYFAPSLYIIPLGISLGTDCDCAAVLLSTMAISEEFGGIGAGFVLNREPFRTIYIEVICVILLTVSLRLHFCY